MTTMSDGQQANGIPQGVETRSFREFRIERQDEDGVTVQGHAATFNDPYRVFDFEEVIAPGAFADAIGRDDVRALLNHDQNIVLGRNKSGTLRMEEDEVGLLVEIDLPESRAEVTEAIERGDIDQMSFGFEVLAEEWQSREDEPDLRTIKEAKLWDVSPVTFPANENTDLSMKADAGIESHREWRSGLEAERDTVDSDEFGPVPVTIDITDEVQATLREARDRKTEIERIEARLEEPEPDVVGEEAQSTEADEDTEEQAPTDEGGGRSTDRMWRRQRQLEAEIQP